MWTTTVKGIAGHRRRFVSTSLAVVLGVAFLTATLVLGDTVRGGFDRMFTEANEGTAVVVRSTSRIGGADTAQAGLVDPSALAAVRAVPGVAAAEAVVAGPAQVVARDGSTVGGDGPPTSGSTWLDEPALNPYRLAEGRAPRATGGAGPFEIVLDRGTATDAGLGVGDATTVLTPAQVPVVVVGIATFGDTDSMAGSTWTAFAPDDAARVLGTATGEASEIRVAAAAGVTEEELASRIATVLPVGTEAVTGTDLSAEQLQSIDDDFLGVLRTMLVVFAGVALLVAAFSIHNTFSIVAAQRSRASALLRAIGASRAQVLGGAALEAAMVGVLATALGSAAGIGLGALLTAALSAADVGLPVGTLVVGSSAVVVPVAVGLGITMLAALGPAMQSARTAPLQALRASAAESTRTRPARTVAGLAAAAGGGALLVSGATGDGSVGRVGLGSLVTAAAFVLLGPVLARPVGRVLGAPARLLRGVTGQLAQENAVRNPRRTAATAAALVVGIGVVSVFTVFASSLRSSVEHEVHSSFGDTDLVVRTPNFAGAGLSPGFAQDVAATDGVRTVATLAYGDLVLDGGTVTAAITDPVALDAVSDLGTVGGGLDQLGDDGIAVAEPLAEDRGWTTGSSVSIGFADGTTIAGRVGAVYDPNASIGELVVPRGLWDAHATQATGPQVMLVGLGDGVELDAVQRQVRALAATAGSPEVETREEYLDFVGEQVNQVLVIVYVLLAAAVLIALLGIANTLTLSIHERTRELGVLRAVGQSRSQLRSMVRWESALVATFGSLAGIGLGAVVGWGLVRSVGRTLALSTVTVPVGQLAVIVVIGAVAGVVAAVRPARRAARVPVLDAIAGP
jgi:putative ABC transport system permease protein